MAGTIVADTIQDGAGNSTSMDNAIYGSAKAWVKYDATAQTITSSYNVSSVTYTATGQFTINFTNAFADTKYTWNINATGVGSGSYGEGTSSAPTTSALPIYTQNASTSYVNYPYTHVVCFR
jgi:hypothetical protein